MPGSIKPDKQQEEYVVKKTDIKEAEVTSIFYYWYCPLCNYMAGNHSKTRLMYAIKLHLMRAHGIKTVIFE
jgi:hypothetical protein